MIVYDIETLDTNRTAPYSNCILRLSETSGKYSGDIKDRELQKRRKYCIVFRGTNYINEMLDHVLVFKKKRKRLI